MSSPDPKPGDLIEISGNIYSHWAICINKKEVIHLTTDGKCLGVSSGLSSSTEVAVIKRESLANVVKDYGYSINNSADKIWEPLPIDRIKKTAKAMVGQRMYYNLTEANCEHFVHLLRYGKKISSQVSTMVSNIPGGKVMRSIFKGHYARKKKLMKTMEDEYQKALPYSYLKRGYLIRIFQHENEHWAMYVGSGEIIHPCKEFGSRALANGAPPGYVIRRERLAKVAPSDQWKIDNCWDNRMEPLPKDQIMKNVNAVIQRKIKTNEKDFIKRIRYCEMGRSSSSIMNPVFIVIVVLGIFVIVYITGLCDMVQLKLPASQYHQDQGDGGGL